MADADERRLAVLAPGTSNGLTRAETTGIPSSRTPNHTINTRPPEVFPNAPSAQKGAFSFLSCPLEPDVSETARRKRILWRFRPGGISTNTASWKISSPRWMTTDDAKIFSGRFEEKAPSGLSGTGSPISVFWRTGSGTGTGVFGGSRSNGARRTGSAGRKNDLPECREKDFRKRKWKETPLGHGVLRVGSAGRDSAEERGPRTEGSRTGLLPGTSGIRSGSPDRSETIADMRKTLGLRRRTFGPEGEIQRSLSRETGKMTLLSGRILLGFAAVCFLSADPPLFRQP